MMNITCIIPARGGSKGIAHKNLQALNGMPLIYWSIKQAIECRDINCGVYVSSDSDEILEVATQAGACPIKRPAELATDTSSSEAALIHAVKYIQQQQALDYVVFLQCTSPIRRQHDISDAISTIITEKGDSLVSVLPIKDFFIWRKSNDSAEPANHDFKNRRRRQDINVQYLENGSIYIFRPSILLETNNRLGGKICLYPMDKLSSQQIDDMSELMLCEHIMRSVP